MGIWTAPDEVSTTRGTGSVRHQDTAALPQHMAVSLRLAGAVPLLSPRLRLGPKEAEPPEFLGELNGKPEAYRHVLRRRRKAI